MDADSHDPPVGENVLEPDPAAAAAYDAAFALYRRRGESLFEAASGRIQKEESFTAGAVVRV